ncbi:MAG: sporulation integral membrane protein YtvI [Clostridia bacterium]|nr:sporulation integral membrane protein YtvI [Clostridia bacterium]
MKFKGLAVKMTIITIVIIALLVCLFTFFGDIVDGVLWLVKVFLPFILAFLLSLALNPLAEKLQKKLKLPKVLTAVIVIILSVGILGGALGGVIWKIVSEIKSIYEQVPQIYESAVETFENIQNSMLHIYSSLPVEMQNVLDNVGDNLKNTLANAVQDNYKPFMYGAGNIAKKLPSIFIGIIVFILSLFFIMSDEEKVKNNVKKLFPKNFLEKTSNVGGQLKKYLGGYIKAQLIIMSVAFVIIFIGLSILKVRYAMLIALGIAALDALPFFGSGAALIPWSIISFLSGTPKMGVGLLIIYLAIIFTRQMIEPKIVSDKLGTSPLLTLMSMYIGYKIFSIGGMILGPILLVLVISFHKAGALETPERVAKGILNRIKHEFKQLYKFIVTK